MGAFSCSGGRLSAFHKAVRAREDEAHERRPFSLATGPEGLLSVPRDLQEPDSLLDVVLACLLVPNDPGSDL